MPHTCCFIPAAILKTLADSEETKPDSRELLYTFEERVAFLASYEKTLSLDSRRYGRDPAIQLVPQEIKPLTVPKPSSRPGSPVKARKPPLHRLAPRHFYDCKNTDDLPGTLVHIGDEGGHKDNLDGDAYDAYYNLGLVQLFYSKVFNRHGIYEDRTKPIRVAVHFGKNFPNALWLSDLQMMVFGDGDEEEFMYNFTGSLDVVCHEYTHGIIDNSRPLEYVNQSGALNESLADVFASMCRQWVGKERAEQADWLIGTGCFFPWLTKEEWKLRNLRDPEKAASHQVKHMKDYEIYFKPTAEDDWGGVHYHSGIPNHAFYLIATRLGGYSWEKAGKIWYAAMTDNRVLPHCLFSDFAGLTVEHAERMFGPEVKALVHKGWLDVGVPPRIFIKKMKSESTRAK